MECGLESRTNICWLFFYLDGFMHSIVEISCHLFFHDWIFFLVRFWQLLQRTNYGIIIQWGVGLALMLSNKTRFGYDISVYNVREMIRFDSCFFKWLTKYEFILLKSLYFLNNVCQKIFSCKFVIHMHQ